MRQFGVEVGATRQRESGLTLPRSAGSDARCRARLAQPSSQLPRDDLTPTTRQSMLLADPAAFRVEPFSCWRPGSRRGTPVPLTVLLPVTGSALECPVNGSA